ncbi:HD domain-containing phosphohydrolase [Bacillus coreaensis]
MEVKYITPDQFSYFLKLADAVCITDIDHTILEVNNKYLTMTGYTKEEVRGRNAGFLKSNLTSPSIYREVKDTLKQLKSWSGVFVNKKKCGNLWHSHITISPIEIENRVYFIGVFRELEQLNQGTYLSESQRLKTKREILKTMAISCEIHDPGIENHLLRVQKLCESLLQKIQERNVQAHYDPSYFTDIVYTSILHDIGKAGIPESILYKPRSLNSYERDIIEFHPKFGVEILSKISIDINNSFTKSLEIAKNIIMYHHEKWDGSGYPFRYKGMQIPFEARVVGIVDVFDALTSRRAYKDAWAEQDALHYIYKERGKHFDPEITDAFLDMFGVYKN